jgi:hypothetical protein
MGNVRQRFRLVWAFGQGGTAFRQATMNHWYRGERRQRGEDLACREPLLGLLDQAMKLAEPTSQLVDCRVTGGIHGHAAPRSSSRATSSSISTRIWVTDVEMAVAIASTYPLAWVIALDAFVCSVRMSLN